MNENSEVMLMLQSFSDHNNCSKKLCNIIKEQIDLINNEIYSFRSELEREDSASILNNYETIRRKYFMANARLLLLTKQYNRKCSGSEEIILFFYESEKDCPECYAQGKMIDEVRESCSNVKVFSFPIDVDMAIIRSFMAYYGIESAPSVVIDSAGGEEKLFNNVVGPEEIEKHIECRAR